MKNKRYTLGAIDLKRALHAEIAQRHETMMVDPPSGYVNAKVIHDRVTGIVIAAEVWYTKGPGSGPGEPWKA